jgi:putative glycosyltransferase (TIGR04348 family)
MRICIVTPASRRSHHGNRATALRWARLLGELGHTVEVLQQWQEEPAELLVALHARRSAPSVERFAAARSDAAIVVTLTGTDLYPDLVTTGVDPSILEAATRLVVLQCLGVAQVPHGLRDRVRVIVQSVAVPELDRARDPATFAVAQLAHLRAVKDPLLVAEAVRQLPAGSRIQVVHAGAVMDADLGERVRRETAINPRYRWLGDLPPMEALGLLARSRVLVLSSRHEGGANVVSEALALGVPILCSRIPGSVGLLGQDYPGCFPVGDAAALRALLLRCADPADPLLGELDGRCTALSPMVRPEREREAWRELLVELGPVAVA